MSGINVSVAGVFKLLNELNPHKAAGPDELKALVLTNNKFENMTI